MLHVRRHGSGKLPKTTHSYKEGKRLIVNVWQIVVFGLVFGVAFGVAFSIVYRMMDKRK